MPRGFPSYRRTARGYPIIEVAYLFIGIFATMTPALIYLNAHAADLGLTKPWQFFYSSGILSAFLDNSPTAVAFHTVAQGLPVAAGATLEAGIDVMLLRAIALGSNSASGFISRVILLIIGTSK